MRIKWLRIKEHLINLARVDSIRLDGKMLIISGHDYKITTINYASDEQAAAAFDNLAPKLDYLYRD